MGGSGGGGGGGGDLCRMKDCPRPLSCFHFGYCNNDSPPSASALSPALPSVSHFEEFILDAAYLSHIGLNSLSLRRLFRSS